MIIFINGAFGVGKSSVADVLTHKLPNSLLYDAEEVGYMLRKIYKPIDTPEDFQDLKAWRVLAVKTAEELKKQYNRTLIMPMCIWNEKYFDEITQGLKAIDNDFHHFCLIADEETVIKRLQQRQDSSDVTKWATDRLQKCLISYQSEKFEKRIVTDTKSPEEIGKEIIANIAV